MEDHDDLLSVLLGVGSKYPSLSTLPASCRPEEPFALTRLISNQDSRNVILVAEDGGSVVGFAVATCDVDVQLLQESFELHPYDGFLSEPVYTALEAAARETVIAKKRWEQGIESTSGTWGEAAAVGEPSEGATASAAAGGHWGKSTHRSQEQGSAVTGAASGTGEGGHGGVEVSAEELRQELLPLLAAALAEDEHRHTLFAVTMLCMKQEYEQQAVDFLEPMFEAFTDKVPWNYGTGLTFHAAANAPHDYVLARYKVTLQQAAAANICQGSR